MNQALGHFSSSSEHGEPGWGIELPYRLGIVFAAQWSQLVHVAGHPSVVGMKA